MAPTRPSTMNTIKTKGGRTLISIAKISKKRKSKAVRVFQRGRVYQRIFKIEGKKAYGSGKSGHTSKSAQMLLLSHAIGNSSVLTTGMTVKGENKDEIDRIKKEQVDHAHREIDEKKEDVKAGNEGSVTDSFSSKEIQGAKILAEHVGRKNIKLEDLELARVFTSMLTRPLF